MKAIATLTLILLPLLLQAQESEIPEFWLDGPTNAGTEFFLSFPSNWELVAGQKYVRIYIGAVVETEVRITAARGAFQKTIQTVPHGVVSVDMANYVAQPYVRGDQSPVPDDQIYENVAVRIESDAPVVVTAINRTSFTSDGYLAMPVSSLGREYVVASAKSITGGTQELPSQYLIVAPYDGTTVSILNSDDTPNNTEGKEITISLNRGDVYSANSIGFHGDLSGTTIVADRPVAVFGGQNCTYLPNENYPACDHIVEMLPPVESWGKFYHSLPIQGRLKGDTYRIFAGEPDAKIYVNGALYGTLPGVGGKEAFGWFEYRQEERTAMEFSSDKPIFVMQYNNSQTYDNAEATDPFMMSLTPVEQYRNELIFSTPEDDFPKNHLALIADSASMERMEIGRAGQDDWKRVRSFPGTSGYRTFPTRHDGKTWVGLVIALEPGVWHVRGGESAAAYLYGQGTYDSYGYPAGMTTYHFGLGDTTDPRVLVELDSCTGEIVGSIRDGNVAGRSAGISSIRSGSGTAGYSLDVSEFRPGIDSAVNFRFNPFDSVSEGTAELVVYDMAGNRTITTIRWDGMPLYFNVDSVFMETALPGEARKVQVVLRNRGSNDEVLTRLTISAPFQIETDDGLTFPIAIPAGDSITITIVLETENEGEFSGELEAMTGCGPLRVIINGAVDSDTDVEEGLRMPERLDLSQRE